MARRIAVAAMSLVLVAISAVQPTRAKMFAEFNKQKQAALQCEAQGKWRQIHWRSTIDQAVADAGRMHLPILVVLVVGKEAKKNADEC
jgi:hypothetical protein